MENRGTSGRHRLLACIAASALVHISVIGLRPNAFVILPVSPLPFRLVDAATEQSPDSVAPGRTSSLRSGGEAAALKAEADHDAVPTSGTSRAASQQHDMDYIDAANLDVRAEPLNDVLLIYPQQAYQWRIKGRVLLQLLISDSGGVDKINVLESAPEGIFEPAALEAVRATIFSPALKYGLPVRSRKVIEVTFDPYEGIHIP